MGVSMEALETQLKTFGFIFEQMCIRDLKAYTADFNSHPTVLDGASDLFAEVFGDMGKHSRAAIGVNSLPMGLPIEIVVTAKCKSL